MDGTSLRATGVHGIRPVARGRSDRLRDRGCATDLAGTTADRGPGPSLWPRPRDRHTRGALRRAVLRSEPPDHRRSGAATAVRSRGARGRVCPVDTTTLGVRAGVLLGPGAEHAGLADAGSGRPGL